MHVLRTRRSTEVSGFTTLLYALCAGASALLMLMMVHRAYPLGIAFPDTTEYMAVGTNEIIDLARPPFTGALLRMLAVTGHPAALWPWLMMAAYVGTIMIICVTATHLLHSRVLGWLCAMGVLLLDTTLAGAVFAHTWMLSDAPYALALTSGTLLTLDGWQQRTRVLCILGIALLGLAGITRPLGAILALWIPLIILCAWPARIYTSKTAALLLCLLLTPLLLWRGWLQVSYGHSGPNPYVARHLATQVRVLLEPGDTVLDDPEANDLLMEAVLRHRLPSDFAFRDPFGRDTTHVLGRIMAVYGSVTPVSRAVGPPIPDTLQTTYALQTAAISRMATQRLILLHPHKAWDLIVERYLLQFQLASLERYEQTTPNLLPARIYTRASTMLSGPIADSLYPSDDTARASPDLGAARLLRRVSVDGPLHRLWQRAALWQFSVAHLAGILSVMLLCIGLYKPRRGSLLVWQGFAGSVLFATIVAHAAPFASVSALTNLRYALAASLLLHVLCLACLMCLCQFIGRFALRRARWLQTMPRPTS